MTTSVARSSNLVPGTQTASIWLDESGARNTARDCFVVGGIKTRHADSIQRELLSLRETHQDHQRELKFGRMDGSTAKLCIAAIEMLADSDARIVAGVIYGSAYNPFKQFDAPWQAQAHVIGRVVQGNINRNEVVNVMMDHITTPPGVAMGQVVKREVNGRLHVTAVIDAVSLNSKSNDMLQLADMIAGAVFYTRLRHREGALNPDKVKVAERLAWAFGMPDLRNNARKARVNIATLADWRAVSGNKTGAPARSRDTRR